MLSNLKDRQIILASKSPRRRELLQMLRVPFKVVTLGGIEETYPATLPAEEVPMFLSNLKANAYLPHLGHDDIVICADTVVVKDGRIYGKPKDAGEAREMLRSLSGGAHCVVSGVTIASHERRTSFTSTTKVWFCPISPEEIDYYVENFHPFDKAGAYGIQEWIGAIAVEKIEGSYYNVMGLPVHRLYHELRAFA